MLFFLLLVVYFARGSVIPESAHNECAVEKFSSSFDAEAFVVLTNLPVIGEPVANCIECLSQCCFSWRWRVAREPRAGRVRRARQDDVHKGEIPACLGRAASSRTGGAHVKCVNWLKNVKFYFSTTRKSRWPI